MNAYRAWLACAALAVAGCPGNEDGGPGTPNIPDVVVKSDKGTVEQPEAPPPPSFPLPECVIAIDSPAALEDGSPPHVHGTLIVAGHTEHPDPDVTMNFAAMHVQHPDCVPVEAGEPEPEACALTTDPVTIPASAFTDIDGVKGNFTNTESPIDLSALPTGEYDVVVAAISNPKEKQDPGSCEARVRIFVDNSCPEHVVDGEPPLEDGDHLLGKLPIRWRAFDDTAVASAKVFGPTGELLAELPTEGDGTGVQTFTRDIDICTYGTENLTFKLTLTDTFGNACDTLMPQHVTRCPEFVTSTVTNLAEGAEAATITAYDVDQDGWMDVVGANSSGILLLRNDGKGGFETPKQIEGIDVGTTWVFPDDFDGKDGTDFAVVTGLGDTTELRVYLHGQVCTKDPAFDPTIYSEEELQGLTDSGVHYPTVCEEGYNLAESHKIGASVLSAMYKTSPSNFLDLVSDPLAAAHKKAADLVFGTDKPQRAVTVLTRIEAPTCAFSPPDWAWDGTLKVVEPPPEPGCFRSPAHFVGNGKVVALGLADFVEDAESLTDIVASFETPFGPQLTIFENKGKGELKAGLGNNLPTSAVALWPNEALNQDLDGTHMDVLAVMQGIGQLWAMFGDGKGGFKKIQNQINPQDVDRTAVCIEGLPSALAVGILDEDPESPSGTEDLVVTNLAHGTLWTFYKTGVSKGGPNYQTAYPDLTTKSARKPQIVDAVVDPVQVLLVDLDKDGYVDAVVRSAKGPIATVFGANPTLDAGDAANFLPPHPRYGARGTFVGSHHAPTPLPNQSVAGITDCQETSQSISNPPLPYMGAPGDRLEPEFMAFADFTKDLQGNLPDLVITTKTAYLFEGLPVVAKNENLSVPMLGYTSNGYLPLESTSVRFMRTATGYCQTAKANGALCTQKVATQKGPVSDVKATVDPWSATPTASANTGDVPDVFIATSTFYISPASDEESDEKKKNFPPLEGLDVFLEDKAKPADGAFSRQWEQNWNKTELPPPPQTPGDWLKLGLIVGSRPKSVAPLKCKTNGKDIDLAVLAEVQNKDFQRAVLTVFKGQGFGSPVQTLVKSFEGMASKGDLPFLVRTGKLTGSTDADTDLFLVSPSYVTVFVGTGNCGFEQEVKAGVSLGAGAVGLAVGDLDGDELADLVVPLGDGTIVVSRGLDGKSFDQPDTSLKVVDAEPAQAELADINGDGWLDILILDGSGSQLLAFMNEAVPGKLSFWPEAQAIPAGKGARQLFAGDLDNDGCNDLATLNKDAKSVSFLQNAAYARWGKCKQGPGL